MQIVPAILSENFEQVIHNLFLVEGVASRVQIDISDGVFGLEKTWLPYKEESLPEGFEYEFDMMVVDWKKYIPRVIALGATRVIAHVDEFDDGDIEFLVRMVSKAKVKLGLCVSNDKDIRDFTRLVNKISKEYSKVFVQVMGIKRIGTQGQPFDEDVIERIWEIGRECKNVMIQVDGSMNQDTILRVKNAGADVAVVGSYIFKAGGVKEIKKRIEKLEEDYR